MFLRFTLLSLGLEDQLEIMLIDDSYNFKVLWMKTSWHQLNSMLQSGLHVARVCSCEYIVD